MLLMWVYTCARDSGCTCVCMYMCVHMHACVYPDIHVMYACLCVCMCCIKRCLCLHLALCVVAHHRTSSLCSSILASEWMSQPGSNVGSFWTSSRQPIGNTRQPGSVKKDTCLGFSRQLKVYFLKSSMGVWIVNDLSPPCPWRAFRGSPNPLLSYWF